MKCGSITTLIAAALFSISNFSVVNPANGETITYELENVVFEGDIIATGTFQYYDGTIFNIDISTTFGYSDYYNYVGYIPSETYMYGFYTSCMYVGCNYGGFVFLDKIYFGPTPLQIQLAVPVAGLPPSTTPLNFTNVTMATVSFIDYQPPAGNVNAGLELISGGIVATAVSDETPSDTELSNGYPPPPVPEPSTWAMMLLGFAGLCFVGRRRRSKVASVATFQTRIASSRCKTVEFFNRRLS